MRTLGLIKIGELIADSLTVKLPNQIPPRSYKACANQRLSRVCSFATTTSFLAKKDLFSETPSISARILRNSARFCKYNIVSRLSIVTKYRTNILSNVYMMSYNHARNWLNQLSIPDILHLARSERSNTHLSVPNQLFVCSDCII